MSDERCEMTDLPVATCDHCSHGIAPREEWLPEVVGDFVVAQYAGVCAVCEEDIIVGDHIGVIKEVKGRDGSVVYRKWGHAGCTR